MSTDLASGMAAPLSSILWTTPFGVGRSGNVLFVAPDVRGIFNYRSRILTDVFPAKSRC